MNSLTINGVCWIAVQDGAIENNRQTFGPHILLERCEKKAKVLGVGEWFVPGGKLEAGESADDALKREIAEEWPGVRLMGWTELPLLEGSAVPPGPRGIFIMRPYRVYCGGMMPKSSSEGVALRWTPLSEALASPVVQVRMMVAAAMGVRERTML